MSFQRRELLQLLPYALGVGFILPRVESAMAAQKPAQTANPSAQFADKRESGGTKMEKVAGIGGLFFRAHDPKALGKWYEHHLGIDLTPTSEGGTAWQQEAGPTVFTPFPETTKHFGDPDKGMDDQLSSARHGQNGGPVTNGGDRGQRPGILFRHRALHSAARP